MATSAIGPGFLTQTSLFTASLGTSFGFVILISLILDIGVQLNIWRMVTMRGERAQDIANKVVPGMGYVLALLVAGGGLVFNIGNIAGTGLGLEVLTGMDVKFCAVISCVIALGIFWYREAGLLMDGFAKLLGLIMILLTLYIAISSHPPVVSALYHTVWPEHTDMLKIITLVGGTVGGYISFAGAHRLLDAGVKGPAQLKQVNKSAISGILITSVMRFTLFFAALGIVSQGITLAAGNPASTVFQSAAGKLGYVFFGIVLWSAAITSVVGASYTSVSFWKTLVPAVAKYEKWVISIFIIISTLIFCLAGNPVRLLVMAGAVNGIILPLALAIMLIASYRRDTKTQYRHPAWLQVVGWIVVVALSWMSVVGLRGLF
ncbi:MAG: divalent metal cation transporter [Chitinophagaceae bacterium]|nr:divalent metal cation transporter [Chitinophagaceae bacterium]MBL0337099.1 divalent metal cation transporter [Chitinophagaceae bacterium]